MKPFFKLAISIALILIPVILVFKNFFNPGPLAFGDAPFFYPESLKELISEPLAWSDRASSFGGVNLFLWLSPAMFLYGLLDRIFGLGNDLIIRVIFYFPSLLLAVFGSYFFAKYLKLSKVTQFFTVLIYILNTYYILLIDGGQVGIALAYGLFPLSLLKAKKFMNKPSPSGFFEGLAFLFLLGIADPRIAAILILTIAVWQIIGFKFKSLVYLFPLILSWLLLNLYWIFPLLKNASLGQEAFLSSLGINSWYDPLILRAPHWPENIFGKVAKPAFYFGFVPILIFAGIVTKRSREMISMFIVFLVFVVLYSFNPLIYLPFGSAFRDSTKFFIPIVLFAGVLIGHTAEALKHWLARLAIFAFVLFLIAPALSGKMNFVLSNRVHNPAFQQIYEKIKNDSEFGQIVWFPEKAPLSFQTLNHPAINAFDLVKFQPFAQMNAGEDPYNFINNNGYVGWFRVLGIKYLILSDNPRGLIKTESEQKDWETINELVRNTNSANLLDSNLDIPVYKIPNSYPKLYSVSKIVAVVGQPLVSTAPSVYFEDGKLDYKNLEGISPDSVVIVFNARERSDLAMSFLQEYFIAPAEATKKEWAIYTKDQYLKYKYELLIRGVRFSDFDYGKGISFSTKKGEKIEFSFNVSVKGTYIFAARSMTPEDGDITFKWKIKELNLEKGTHREIVENNSDMQVLNTVALIPKSDFEEAQKLANVFTTHFKVIDKSRVSSLEDKYQNIEIDNAGTLKYKFDATKAGYWLIMNTNYHPLWQLGRGRDYFASVPIYSMINGFYVDPAWGDTKVEFRGQENFRWGLYGSVVSMMIMTIIYLWTGDKQWKKSK